MAHVNTCRVHHPPSHLEHRARLQRRLLPRKHVVCAHELRLALGPVTRPASRLLPKRELISAEVAALLQLLQQAQHSAQHEGRRSLLLATCV
jgi:hypothetical protein